jgi:hypothetical protein
MAGPDNDPFASQLRPTLRSDIETFTASIYVSATSTSDPTYSLQHRFVVTLIGLNKAGYPAEHESIAIWVLDKKTLEKHEYVIERGPSKHSYTSRFSAFSQYRLSGSVVDSIQKAILNMRSLSSEQAESLSASMVTETEMIPLLPLAFDSVSLTDIPASGIPPSSSKDVVTSTLAKVFALTRTMSRTISPQTMAEDSISGRPTGTLNPGSSIRFFKPVELSLFDVALLGSVVHEVAPIYGLFDNQCYMFASVIFDAVVQHFTLTSGAFDFENDNAPPPSTSSEPVPYPSPDVGAPSNANVIFVPSPADDTTGRFPSITAADDGRWSGLLIVDPIVKQAIVNVVISEFKTLRKSYMDKLSALRRGP